MTSGRKGTDPGRRRPARDAHRVLVGLAAVLVTWLVLPLVLFVVHAPGQLDPHLRTPGLRGAVVTSLLGATVSTLVVLLLGVPLARLLAGSRSWVARVVGVLVQLPLALPPVMSGIVLIEVVGPYSWLGSRFGGNLTDSFTGVVLAQTFVAAPFLVIAARGAFAAIPPATGDLARTAGLHRAARFWRVDLPLASRGIVAGALLTWLRAMGEYGATSLLAYHPYTLPVYVSVQFDSAGLPATVAPTLLALALAVAVLVVLGVRWSRPRRAPRIPAPERPLRQQPVAVGFDLCRTVGTFRLEVRHEASSHRLAILGPSAAGKSLTLRAIAGLLDAGPVHFGADAVRGVSAEDRLVGWVAQDHLLFEHRTVWRNAVFARGAVPGRAAWWLHTLGIEHLAGRMPAALSGGERQRASLAQALARDPRVLLLDEPFSALDSPTREELRLVLRDLQQRMGLSTVLVTHDPRDALLLSDDVVVLAGGRVVQDGPTREVFEHPADAGVARLLGQVNVLPGTMAGHPDTVRVGDMVLRGTGPSCQPGTPVTVRVAPAGVHLDAGSLAATVLDVLQLPGDVVETRVRLDDGTEFLSRAAGSADAAHTGDRVHLAIDAAAVRWWQSAGAPSTPTMSRQ